MILIQHRINTAAALRETPPEYGIELDLRTKGKDLIIHHDPFVEGENFEEWVKEYRHRMLILNVKEEGLEGRLLSIMEERGIEDFFFLDQSFPFLIKTSREGEKRCAVRVSEYESMDTAKTLEGKVRWVWLDCFTKFPLSKEEFVDLNNRFDICIVSPELQGRFDEDEIIAYKNLFAEAGTSPAAVCTKFPQKWA